MPPKRRAGRDEESESDTDVELSRTVVASPNITMSEQMLHSLVSNITKSQAEANRVLIESILASHRDTPPCTSTPRSEVQGQPHPGNFAKCTARFNGASKNADELEAFIDAIEVYRDCTNISDEHALRGLPMLLVGEAAVWWQGVKSSVTSWSDALQRLRGMFGVPRPGYKLFRDIFADEQNSERADVFICKVRALISKFPYVVPEVMKLDIVYGLLNHKIRKRVSRDAVEDLEQLITKVRLVEESLAEVSQSHKSNTSLNPMSNPSAAAHDRSCSKQIVNPASAVGESSNSNKSAVRSLTDSHTTSNSSHSSNAKHSDSEGQKRVRPKCVYCKLFGHTVEDCRNKNKKHEGWNTHTNSAQLRCYGCGQLGVVRSKCDNCKNTQSSTNSDFRTVHVVDSDDSRPLVEIKVVNRTGVAILDTGATHSIAGPMLHTLLADAGVQFREVLRTIGLADGSQQVCKSLECYVNVTLGGRSIPTKFMVLPDAQTRTLLGRDFIMRASILLDLPQSSWRFNDEPQRWHPFITSFSLPPTADETQLMKIKVANLMLRDDEGTKLTAEQKVQLNGLLVKRTDRFAKEGPPTEYATHRLKVEANQETIASTPYRMAPGKKAVSEQELQKLRDADVIQEDEYNLRIEHTPGRSNAIADTLSRPPCADETECEVCFAEVDSPSRNPKHVRENQLKYLEVRKIVEDLESTDDPFRGRSWSDKGVLKSDGVLYRYGPDECEEETACLVGPEHEREKILDEYHSAPDYNAGDLVLLKTQGSNDAARGQTPKFIPRRDGPYRIKEATSATTYILERVRNGEILGRYHVSQLTPFVGDALPAPVNEKRKRGRPKRFLD